MKGEHRTPSFLLYLEHPSGKPSSWLFFPPLKTEPQLVRVAPVQIRARAHASLYGDRLNLENLAECRADGRALSLFSPAPWSPCVHAGARQRLL